MRSRFLSDSDVFATMTAEFRNETGLDFKPVQKNLFLGTRLEGQDVGPEAKAGMCGVI